MIHPHLPVGIPCYDLVLIADLALGNFPSDCSKLEKSTSGAADFAGLTGSVYEIWERIHRGLLTRDYYQFQLHAGKFQPAIRTETTFKDWLRLAPSQLVVVAIVGCVLP